MTRIDLTGKKFGKLTVLNFYDVDKYGQSEWVCECECGNKIIAKMGNLRRGHTTSCGCRKYERFSEDLTGKQFGRLAVLGFDHIGLKGRAYWCCRCQCGEMVVVRQDELKSGHTTSCGCYAIDINRERCTKHGLSTSRLYSIWRGMRERCRDTTYQRYGGRGITVCDEWNDFKKFYDWSINNGYDSDLTIDCINNDGDYCPENCRWTDYTTQGNNRCTNRYIEYNGETHTVAEWSRILNVHVETLRHRIKQGNMSDFRKYFDN